MKCVELIIVDPYNLELYEDKWYHEAYADVYPEDAACRCVTWHSDNPSVASVNAESGYIHAEAPGTANIYATACDGSGVSGVCHVTVKDYIPVTNVVITPTRKNLIIGDTFDLNATIYPENSTDKFLIWSSSDPRIATVDPLSGEVTAIALGKTVITVKTYDDDEKKDTCLITVTPDNDTREKVLIKKYDDYFEIIFPNNKIWKSVGRDLSLDDNTSGNLGYGYLEWANLYPWERRFLDNFQNSYTVDQLAYIYYFDPLGVEAYTKNNQAPVYNNKTMLEKLNFKDSLYNKIFGIIPNKFYFDAEGEYNDYQNYIGWNRLDYYSNAEILFGWHRPEFDFNRVYVAVMSTLFEIAIGSIPLISDIQDGITLYKYAFYGASINDFSETLLTEYLEPFGVIPLAWVISLLSAIGDATFSQFEIPNDMTIDVYYTVNSLENYRTVFLIGETEVSMSDVIEHC